ncbi:hypothetical protein JYU34_021401 [Plutella xylostella]|uniref:Trimethylguanosine synthase n=1 Tax=Plutella xylostella TaxID=51655 RepID=A0ABQ7PTG8_PLUXY|nr:hypothetical protein JYU34_021401 [Plutella xylostella]
MISEDYDHRWEALAEVHFSADGNELTDDNYIYCLCSRVFIRDGVKLYYAEKEECSESEAEAPEDLKTQELDDQSHVHFSLDTSYKVKCEKDEGASCYCSASHTDNYCSTDEHDPGHAPAHTLQPSDSGADLTYQEGHSDTTTDKPELMDVQDINNAEFEENYLSECTWDKFWAINGERIIWASWIKKYSDYINPSYLDENNDLTMEEANLPRDKSVDHIFNTNNNAKEDDDSIRERKFSYDSKVNPYKKNRGGNNGTEKAAKYKDDSWLIIERKRSCSEHERMLSPRTLAGTDSMTNVTKITLSSYDVASSHVTSESSPTDDYSVSSSTSDDPSNDQTRIANIIENTEVPAEEMDTDQYWQFLWKQHFGEQYALHFANYTEKQNTIHNAIPAVNMEAVERHPTIKEKLEIEYDHSDGNSQEMQTIIEVQDQVGKIKIDDKPRNRKRNKKSTKAATSVGLLLQLLKDEHKNDEVFEAAEDNSNSQKSDNKSVDVVDSPRMDTGSVEQTGSSDSYSYSNNGDGGDEPPEDRAYNLKRSHETDDDNNKKQQEEASQKIQSTFDMMGLCLPPDCALIGQLVYRKRRVRPPRMRRRVAPRKTYFDDEGNPCEVQDSNEEQDMQTDDEAAEAKPDCDKGASFDVPNNPSDAEDIKDITLEATETPLPEDVEEAGDMVEKIGDDEGAVDSGNVATTDPAKRRRRKRRRSPRLPGDVPPELAARPDMMKYWKKRHSLFHRFDEGIRLDLESWFSVTPERVSQHIAERCRCDVIVDAFCGAGGNALQLPTTCERVIAIDIDPCKIALARHNATIYGVADRIEFIVGDFFQLAPTLKADVVFLSPPWGGPKYAENEHYDLETMLEPRPASQLMAAAETVSHNIALYVPRNTRSDQLVELAKTSGAVEIEQNFLGRRFIALTAYYGELVNY